MQTHLENMAAIPEFAPVKDHIDAGLSILSKYYSKADAMDAYIICMGKQW